MWIRILMIAARNLGQRPGRTLLLGAVVAVVTAVLALLIGLAAGARSTVLTSRMALSSGHLNVVGFFKPTAGQISAIITDYQQVLEVVRKLPGLDHVVARGGGYVTVVSETRSEKKDLVGINLADEPLLAKTLRISSGELAALQSPGNLLLFEAQAEKLKVKVGDRVTLSSTTFRGSYNAVDVRVGAIAKDMGLEGNVTTFVDESTWRRLYLLNSRTTTLLQIYLQDPDRAPEAHAQLRAALEQAGHRLLPHEPAMAYWMKFDPLTQQDWTGQKLDLSTWMDEEGVLAWVFKGMNVLSGLLVTFLVLLISLGVSNTMWIAIQARTREIGALRALGMGRGSVMWMVLFEGLLLGLAGTLTGALLGWGIGTAINQAQIPLPIGAQLVLMSDHLQFQLHPLGVLGSAVLITGVLGFMSLFPALSAARLQPALAIAHT